MYKDFRNEDEKSQTSLMDDISFSNMVTIEALLNLLIRKHVLSKEEVIAETKRVKDRWELLKGMKTEKQ